MEQKRLILGLLYSITMFILLVTISWYIKINKIDIILDTNRINLSDKEKVDTFGVTRDVNKYEAFYESYTTLERTRTMIPFVYNYKEINVSPLKLYTQKTKE